MFLIFTETRNRQPLKNLKENLKYLTYTYWIYVHKHFYYLVLRLHMLLVMHNAAFGHRLSQWESAPSTENWTVRSSASLFSIVSHKVSQTSWVGEYGHAVCSLVPSFSRILFEITQCNCTSPFGATLMRRVLVLYDENSHIWVEFDYHTYICVSQHLSLPLSPLHTHIRTHSHIQSAVSSGGSSSL